MIDIFILFFLSYNFGLYNININIILNIKKFINNFEYLI